jgi:SAM-dependent methyltransferase
MNAARSEESTTIPEESVQPDLEEAGRFWVREAHRWDGTSGRFGEAMLDAAGLEPGQRVLDIGCGAGSTTVDAGRRVTPGGAAVGVDISGPALALARERTAAARLDNVEYIEADAQTHRFGRGAFDAVISRFGTMFFGDPVAAFANLRRALRPDGRLAIVAWQGALQNEWTAVAGAVAVAHFGRPPDLGAPDGPGPFAFADGDRFRRVVEAGGFGFVTIDAITRPMLMGNDADDVAAMVAATPQSKALFADQPTPKIEAAIAGLRDAFAPYARPEGVVMKGTAWLLTARS